MDNAPKGRRVARPGNSLCLDHDLGLLASGRGGARPPPPVVSVVEARQLTVPIMAEPIGTTRALQEVSIRPGCEVPQEMHFNEGTDVKTGQLLFVIDEEPFKAELAAARAKLEQAEANAEEGRRTPRRGRSQPPSADANSARAGRGRGAARTVAVESERIVGR